MKDKYLIDEATLRRILAELDRLRQDNCHYSQPADLLVRQAAPRAQEA